MPRAATVEGDRDNSNHVENPKIQDQFRPWMLVTCKARRVNNRKDTRGNKGGASTNFIRESKVNAHEDERARNLVQTPYLMKDKVGKAVLEALGLLKDSDFG